MRMHPLIGWDEEKQAYLGWDVDTGTTITLPHARDADFDVEWTTVNAQWHTDIANSIGTTSQKELVKLGEWEEQALNRLKAGLEFGLKPISRDLRAVPNGNAGSDPEQRQPTVAEEEELDQQQPETEIEEENEMFAEQEENENDEPAEQEER